MIEKDYEKMFLGCLLAAADNPAKLSPLTVKSYFFNDMRNGRIFQTFFKQLKEGAIPNISTLSLDPDLKDITETDRAYIAEISGFSIGNMQFYEKEIVKAYKKRVFSGAIKTAQEKINAAAFTGDIDPVIHEFMAVMSGAMNDKNEGHIKTARELLTAEYPPIKWIFPGLIGEGLTMLNGAPKIGKSWFVLGAALAASQGGAFLGEYKAPTEGVETLYISLEDTERRLSDRLRKLNAGSGNEKLRITTAWQDSVLGLDNYLAENKETGFVIIDTLGRFFGSGLDDMNDYAGTVSALSRIKKIADSRGVAILIVHHARKGGNSEKNKGDWMDDALGSAGIAGSADASIFISKPRPKEGKANAPELWATGRDAEDIHRVLKFDADCGWTIAAKEKNNIAPRKEKATKTYKMTPEEREAAYMRGEY